MNLEFLKDIRYQRIILIVLVALLVFFLFKCNSINNDKIGVLDNNISALNDTVRYVRTKNGQLEAEKAMFIADLDGLKKLSDSLYKELIKEKGTVKTITIFKVVYSRDTIYIDSTKAYRLNDTLYKLEWEYKHYSKSLARSIDGLNYFVIDTNRNIKDQVTIIANDYISLNLVTGIKFDNNLYKIFIRLKDKEDEKYVTFPEIEGTIVDESIFKKPNWSIGPFVGAGISGPLNALKIYPTINWTVGLGVQYSFYSF